MQWHTTQPQKSWNPVICDHVNGPRDPWIEWSQSWMKPQGLRTQSYMEPITDTIKVESTTLHRYWGERKRRGRKRLTLAPLIQLARCSRELPHDMANVNNNYTEHISKRWREVFWKVLLLPSDNYLRTCICLLIEMFCNVYMCQTWPYSTNVSVLCFLCTC